VRPRSAAVLLASVITLGGCVSPAFGPGSYRGKAEQAIGAALSEVATAQLVTEQMLADRIPKPYADETISASEGALGSISDSFGAVQPPTESDDIQEEVSEALEESASAVTDARIAVRRGDRTALETLVEELRRVAEQLAALEERLR
jgi:hypothetical protein